MHFLMPDLFASHSEFKDWFSRPLQGILYFGRRDKVLSFFFTDMIEGSEAYNEDLVNRLHAVLRPFILRRLKKVLKKHKNH